MSITVTERGQTYEIWTSTDSDETYTKGVECAYVRPCGRAPGGMYIPAVIVQSLIDDELVWANEPPDGADDDLYDLGLTGARDDRAELRILRTVEERIYDAFLVRTAR